MRWIGLLCLLVACGETGLMNEADAGSEFSDLARPDLSVLSDLSVPSDAFPDLVPPQPDLSRIPPDLSVPCPSRTAGEWHVSPNGDDTLTLYTGNGSAACPMKTISAALQAAVNDGTSATLFIHKTLSGSPTIYGSGCTGGPPCDVAVSAATAPAQTIVMQGDGAPSDIVITSGDNYVVGLSGAATLTNVTVQPVGLGESGLGASGILINNPAATVSNVIVNGSTTSPRTGFGIVINITATGANIGPGIVISGGTTGIGGSSSGYTLTGTVAAPTTIQDTSYACIIGGAASIKTGTPGVRTVTLSRCGSFGFSGVDVDGATISNAGSITPTAVGLSATGTITNTSVSSFNGTGIQCLNCTISGNVTVSQIVGAGVSLAPASGPGDHCDITGLTSTNNTGDGLRCFGGAVLTLSNSVLSGNTGNGLSVYDTCILTLSNNEFNRNSNKNGLSGLCLLETNTNAVDASGSTFGCGYSGSGCSSSGTPTTMTASTCQTADITVAAGLSLTTNNPTCCN
jgi:hypothetical protein